MSEHTLIDLIVIILVRGGLSPKKNYSNGLAVFRIEEANEFMGTTEPQIKIVGYVHFQGGEISLRKTQTEMDPVKLDLSNPEFYIDILKYFEVEDYEFQIFKDHKVFEGI